MFKGTQLFAENYKCNANVVINQGGTSSGKTYSILQTLFLKLSEQERKVCTIVGQDIPNLKVGALRDALDIYNTSPEIKQLIRNYNKTERIFEFNNGSIMEFNSYDDAQDAKSGKRDYLFINEANGVPYPVYTELSIRTKDQEFIDYNPNAEFWVHEFLIGQPNTQLFISDHRHNPFLTQRQRDKIEKYKDEDEQLWRVYARGLTGKIEGLIIRNWQLCEQIPEEARFIAAGMDFGFTNDPTTLIEVYSQNGELWVNELLFKTGLTNPDINEHLQQLNWKDKEIIADSAEPKSITELVNLGLNIRGATKGPDSIKNGIDILKRYKINVTRASVNMRKELNNYKYKIDKLTGKTINEPVDAFNHIIDPLRYVGLDKLGIFNDDWYIERAN